MRSTRKFLEIVLTNLVIPIQAVPMCLELLQAMLAHLVNSEEVILVIDSSI